MNLETATYPELERARLEKEAECLRLYIEARDDGSNETQAKLKKCEEELYRIAKALDREMRR